MPDKSTYQRICERECKWCASLCPFVHVIGKLDSGPVHRVGKGPDEKYLRCKAPSRDTVIERQAREIKELRRAIRQTVKDNLHLADGDNCTLRHLIAALKEETNAEGLS